MHFITHIFRKTPKIRLIALTLLRHPAILTHARRLLLGDRTISTKKTIHKWVEGTASNPETLKHLPHWLLFTVGVSALGLAIVLSPNEAVSRGDNALDTASSIQLAGQSSDVKLVSLSLPIPQSEESLTSDIPAIDNQANLEISEQEETPLVVASISPNTATYEPDTIAVDEPEIVEHEENLNVEPVSALIPAADVEEESELQPVKVKNGESLALILDRMGVSPRQVYDLVSVGEETDQLTQLHPGDVLNVGVKDGELKQLRYEIDHERTLDVRNTLAGFDALIIYHDLENKVKTSTGTIQSSLFLAAKDAGLSTNLTMELASIFGWDIDFVLDIRTGDQFTVLYEEVYREGKKIRDGDIIAAEFINQGKIHRALRYTDADNRTAYYTPEGRSLKSTFLRTPIEFARVSSKFNLKRRHPVLNRIRAHKGVDYAAPTGTPIRATADGKVTFRGTKGGYGKTVVLQHGSKYTTLYAHLSNYKRGVTSGKTVKQGDVIGFVGKTGLATGPHLHYEFRVDGVHRNPLTVKLPSAAPIKKAYLADFQKQTQDLMAKLDELSQTAIAIADN